MKASRGYLVGALLVSMATALVSCRSGNKQRVSMVGSNSLQPFVELLAEAFHHVKPDIQIEVQGPGSTVGLKALDSGIAEIAPCSRPLNEEEAGKFKSITVARDGLAIIVHPSNSVSGLTREQVQRMYAGEVTNWSQVGGPDKPVRVITRDEASGTRGAFEELVMKKKAISNQALVQESNGAIMELVSNDPAAVGYVSMGLALVNEKLKSLPIDSTAPSVDGVRTGSYPLSRPFLFVYKDKIGPLAQQFVDFVLSDAGQMLLEKEGLVRAK